MLIIGAGPAGLAAALEASKLGIKDILMVEKNHELGGILQQCIHDGFGIHRFKKQLSGPQYAQVFMDELMERDVNIFFRATKVIEYGKVSITIGNKVIYEKRRQIVRPQEMIHVNLTEDCLQKIQGEVCSCKQSIRY